MHQKHPNEMSELEKVENEVRSITDALIAKGIEIPRVVPIILGRKPRGMPVTVSVHISKPDRRQIRLVSEQQSTDDIGIRDWDVDIVIEPGGVESGIRDFGGWIELSDARLMRPQKCWAQGNVDVEGTVEQGDRVNLQFNNSDWRAEATITGVANRRIIFAERSPHPLREIKNINAYNEYRPKDRLLDMSQRELVIEKVGIMGKTVIRKWTDGRPGPNRALNELRVIPGSIPLPGESTYNSMNPNSPVTFRTIDVWCSQYKNSSKDGIEMTVELPTRRA
jgi:hypothetical protein